MKLRTGWIVELDGKPHRVAMVNESRARCEPVAKRVVTVTPLVGDKKTFEAALGALNISSYSDVRILAKSLEQFRTEQAAARSEPTTSGNQSKEHMTTDSNTIIDPAPPMKTNKTRSTKPARTSKVDRAVDRTAAKANGKGKTETTAPRKLSKCAYIDSLYTGDFTIQEILEHTLAKFPEADPKATLSTVRARPGHIRKAGGTPKWKEEEKATA